MSTEVTTIAALLGMDDRSRAAAGATLLARSGKLAAGRLIPGPLRQAAAEHLIDTSVSMLNSPLAEIFGEAWSTAKQLKKLAAGRNNPTGEVHEVEISSHDISLARTPVMEVSLDGAPAGVQIDCELKLKLAIKSVTLRVRDGAIIGARMGDFLGSGSYACADVKLVERKTDTFRLPGDLAFSPPVPLPG